MTIALGRFDFAELIRAEVSDYGNPHGYPYGKNELTLQFPEDTLIADFTEDNGSLKM